MSELKVVSGPHEGQRSAIIALDADDLEALGIDEIEGELGVAIEDGKVVFE